MYTSLPEMERKLDWTMTRKRTEIQDALARVPHVGCLCVKLCLDDADAADVLEPYSLCASVAGRG